MEGLTVKWVAVGSIRPYDKNPRKNDSAVDAVAASIKEFGWQQPIVVDKDGVIIAGHTRYKAAKKLKAETVPVVVADNLTDEQVRAYRLADNKSGELAEWDMDLLMGELAELDEVDMEQFGFSLDLFKNDEWEMSNDDREQQFIERMERSELSDDDEEYQAFLKKFEAKKTTDDCYTPPNIYDVVKAWAVEKYELGNAAIIRPFYPGGNYKNEKYPAGCVVLDNPPFSIISEICEWYTSKGIRFFLFAPTLTVLGIASGNVNYVICGCGVVYENGALVNTSFVTNMGASKIAAASDLRKAMEDENKKNLAERRRELPKYEYPNEVLTATKLSYLAEHGESFEVDSSEVYFIRALDDQKARGKGLFGSGFLLSEKAAAEKAAAEKAAAEKAAAEKAAAEKWKLSEREWEIIRGLGRRQLNGSA